MIKLKSFTVIELIMTMLLASIVTTICYAAFFLINDRFRAFQEKSYKMAEFRMFYKVLHQDFREASEIISESSSRFRINKQAGAGCIYEFNDSFIVRQREVVVDSFKLKNSLEEITYLNDTVSLINSLRLAIDLYGDLLPVAVNKEYTPKQLITYYYLSDE